MVSLAVEAGERGREADIPSPLMYTWHGTHYLGAAHGLAGIATVLLQVTCAAHVHVYMYPGVPSNSLSDYMFVLFRCGVLNPGSFLLFLYDYMHTV